MAKPELHLFIIWEHGRHEEQQILADLKNHFKIRATYEIQWSKKYFNRNLSRFYGTKLPKDAGKERQIGTGPFLVVIVEDETPEYNTHPTTKGDQHVNSKMFEAKVRYRELLNDLHRVHSTYSAYETEHDLLLLFGLNTKDFTKGLPKNPNRKPIAHRADLVGAEGWDSLAQFFYVLNPTIPYVVLRNYEPLPKKYYAGKHGDIDLLLHDYEDAMYLTNATPVFSERYRVHTKVTIAGDDVLFDFRSLGDYYYDPVWEQNILDRRRLLPGGVYVPSEEDHLYSLLYHALIHKPEISDDYIRRFREIDCDWVHGDQIDVPRSLEALSKFMASQDYTVVKPHDKSVFMNQDNATLLRTKLLRRKNPLAYYARRISDIF